MFQDEVISLNTRRHELLLDGKTYGVYIASMNFTNNSFSDDLAYIRITHENKIYDNMATIDAGNTQYPHFDYLLNNHKGYQRWLADGGNDRYGGHVHVEVTKVSVEEKRLVFEIVDEGRLHSFVFQSAR